MTSSIPSYPYDIFTDEVLLSPYEHYAALRELGPVAWLEAHQVYALPRYAEVRAVLSAPETFCSGQGVGMNEMVNTIGQGTTLMSDGEQHRVQRQVLAHRLMPRALRPMREMIQARADELADVLVRQRRFDAVSDLARALPLSIVPDLVGWPENGREHLLDWASAAFDSLGPMNARAEQAGPRVQAMFEFAARTTAERNVLPDSAAAEMLEAVDSGQLSPEQATSLVIDYVAPSLDTTISAIGSAIWLFAENPEQWKTLQADPRLIANAFDEVVRLESPIRVFTRMLTTDASVGGIDLPAGARVLLMFASANRDERRWQDPARFDVTRQDAAEHVGFGYGLHGCAGQGLARLEGQAVLQALLTRADGFELGEATRSLNNLIHAFASLQVTVRPIREPASAVV